MNLSSSCTLVLGYARAKQFFTALCRLLATILTTLMSLACTRKNARQTSVPTLMTYKTYLIHFDRFALNSFNRFCRSTFLPKTASLYCSHKGFKSVRILIPSPALKMYMSEPGKYRRGFLHAVPDNFELVVDEIARKVIVSIIHIHRFTDRCFVCLRITTLFINSFQLGMLHI